MSDTDIHARPSMVTGIDFAQAMKEFIIALLGHRNEPADGVEDYCTCLGQALMKQSYELRLVRVPWAEFGWIKALRWLWNESVQWRGKWVLVQYTALTWSKKGFPLALLPVLWMLRQRKVRLSIVFHDVTAYPGDHFQNRIRRMVQHGVMRYSLWMVECSIFTVDPKRLRWLGHWATHPKVILIPVGSNVPVEYNMLGKNICEKGSNGVRTVVVFGVSGGKVLEQDVVFISQAVQRAAAVVGPLQLVVLGRDSLEAGPLLQAALEGTGVNLKVLGLLPANRISEILSSADVQLFVRGEIDSHRTTAIAGIAHGLPLVGFAGELTAFPITEAGVRLVYADSDSDNVMSEALISLSEALITVLRDSGLRAELRERSREASKKYFSWECITECLLRALCI